MSGLHRLGQRSPVVGAWSDGVTDYDYGETKVIQLVQFFNALGRPKEFEADVERVYAAYENTKAWLDDKMLKWKNATQMKQVGADAAVLMDVIRASGAHGNGVVAASSKVPTQIDNPVYTPGKDEPTSWLSWVPWWGWTLIAVPVVAGVGIFAGPLIVAAMRARSLTKAS